MRLKKFWAVLLTILFVGSTAPSLPQAVIASESTEIISDGSFEKWNQNSTGFSEWTSSGAWGTKITAKTDGGKENSSCIFMAANSNVSQWRTGFSDDTKYTFTAWLRGSGKIQIVLDWYEKWNPVSGSLGAGNSDKTVFNSGETWEKLTYTFRPPKNATTALLYIKAEGAAALYVDDVSLKPEGEPMVGTFEPAHVFFYTEWGTGTLKFSPNLAKYPRLSGGKVHFTIPDGAEAWEEEKTIVDAGEITAEFSLENILGEMGKKYTARAEVYDSEGTLRAKYEEPIYRYNRPTYLGQDGIFRKNGVSVDPVLMTGLGAKGDYKGAASLGATVATAYSNVANERINYIGNIFGDDVDGVDPDGKPDLYAAVLLYSNDKPAGHDDNIVNTKAKVQEIKENKNLFGYAIMDEPFAAMSEETAKELLALSYKTIRDIDPHHPIYIVETRGNFYQEAAKYCDILFPDIYPGNTMEQSEYVAELTDKAVAIGLDMNKPVYVLHQAYDYGGWTPTGSELRNSIYRAMLQGAKGFGYYCFENAVGETTLKETDMGTMLMAFSGEEQRLLFDLFLRGEKKGEGETAGAVWQAITHGGRNYLVAANRSMESTNTASVVLTPGASLTKVFGEGEAENLDGFIRISLPKSDAAVFEVTVPEGTAFIGESPALANGDMEAVSPFGNYPDGWDRVAGGTPAPAVSALYSMSDAAEAHSGMACAKIGGIIGNPYVHYRTPYVHGENYEVSFYFKYKEAAKKGVPRIEVRKSMWGDVILDGVTGKTYENTIPDISAEEWVKCTYHFTAPTEGADPLAICLYGSADTVCCYDDVVLRPIESEGIRVLTKTGEMHSKKDESPAVVLGWYFPKNASNESIMLLKGSYAVQNGIKELISIQIAEQETNAKAVTLKIDCTAALGESEKVFLWKNGVIPILKKTTLK